MTTTPPVTEAAVLRALQSVRDPEGGTDVVALGMVRDLAIHGGEVSFTLAFTTQPAATKVALHSGASRAVSQLAGVSRARPPPTATGPRPRPGPPAGT
jgi:ATP-binding protein involved in chromosome partitioning